MSDPLILPSNIRVTGGAIQLGFSIEVRKGVYLSSKRTVNFDSDGNPSSSDEEALRSYALGVLKKDYISLKASVVGE